MTDTERTITVHRKDDGELDIKNIADEVKAAAWAAHRRDEVTYLDDQHGHIAAIVPADKTNPRVLTLREAGLLGDLMRGVWGKAKLKWYQFGTRDADHPLIVTMRAFTYYGGSFIKETDDVRDAYVWCSGFMERWIKVTGLIKALDNMDGKHGLENPMAVIEYKE